MASLFIFVNPNYRPSSPALLPQGEKGANHGDHMLQMVQFTSFIAPYSRHDADMFPFSCVRLRFANRTYGFKTGGLYPNSADESPFRPLSRPRIQPCRYRFSGVTNPLGGFVTSDERHSSTATSARSSNHTNIFIYLKTAT